MSCASKIRILTIATRVSYITFALSVTQLVFAKDLASAGKELAENSVKGNCVACHDYQGAEMPGTIGPALVAMKARYPDKNSLFNQIWDAGKKNPKTIMPPFGTNKILSKSDIEAITEWVWTL